MGVTLTAECIALRARVIPYRRKRKFILLVGPKKKKEDFIVLAVAGSFRYEVTTLQITAIPQPFLWLYVSFSAFKSQTLFNIYN
jgi:hypothetical protein